MKQDPLSNHINSFWSLDTPVLLQQLDTRTEGLKTVDIEERREKYGANTIKLEGKKSDVLLFLGQFKSPITIILLIAASLSFYLDDHVDALIIIIIVCFSSMLGFWQERAAGNAIAQLLAMVRIKANVLRDEKAGEIPVEDIVPGDIVLLSAGDVIPADSLILESNELFVDEAAFTGETFPVEKQGGTLAADTPLAKRSNSLFMGSHVISGTAKAIVVGTGINTEFGRVSQSLKNRTPETEFERGIRRFGYFLMQITLIMVIFIFGVNVMLNKPVLDSLLFTLAIAVGLTPQLLPAIITVNLAQGARRMAQKQVIVKRLSSIENFGCIDILCSDKTGTLTAGNVKVNDGLDCAGKESAKVLNLAKINAMLQQGFKNPIDEAISALNLKDYKERERLDEIPYDFIRKRLTLLVSSDTGPQMITKGAVSQVTEVCSYAEDADGKLVSITEAKAGIQQTYEVLSAKGYRTLGVAYKNLDNKGPIHREDEKDMVFAGFVTLFDPPKEGIVETIKSLQNLGIHLKVITGDNALIARSMSEQVGMKDALILTGSALRDMSDEALRHQVLKTDIFAEVEPNHKERIILALKKAGRVVGYMGDGINDASALHAADVGISVNTAVDVAKEAADIVLLDQDLNVLIEGVKEGRRTFANTQKYIFMATSANFGNMFSMAGASLFLSFLPLLPKQILLTNLMTDLPSMAIATDNVDAEWTDKPRRWDINFIKRFMLIFGILSSVFDYFTFGVLLFFFHAAEKEFQTGWFIESVVSATLIVMVVRTRKTILTSKPGKYLLIATLLIAILALLLPIIPFANIMGFIAVPFKFYLAMLAIVMLYIFSAELVKSWFYKRFY
ncbi:MAG: magnesium-translocating P-type ATPase [Candidatus Pedobacter colombiensis]|uniref:Magnesium-transporting ATPase, P-type 1 n=1 Tax=Candidatus Pedobacter colombiensis TaxID=3121371 RepID=A0AAJ5WBI2_9SPHI|nr:magnesium-translocating P-type ATPase [Pedobacter sp.]WEK20621.1 MAG: magnesium-translocating P-type ATPase [Pedobacter sp.]